MKRCLSLCLSLTLLLALSACNQGKGPTSFSAGPIATSPEPIALALEEPQSVEGVAYFKLMKIQTTDRIDGTIGGGRFYENTKEREIFLEMVLDVANVTAATLSARDLLAVKAMDGDETTYSDALYAVETDHMTSLTQDGDLEPGIKYRLHCAVSVPETAKHVTVVLSAQGQEFTYAYTVGETIRNMPILTEGKYISQQDFGEIIYLGMHYTDDLLPADTSGDYKHYAVDDPEKTYLAILLTVTNRQNTAAKADTFVAASALCEEQTYRGFVVTENVDRNSFRRTENLEPGVPRTLYCLIEVPKTAMEQSVVLTLVFGGQEYQCQVT